MEMSGSVRPAVEVIWQALDVGVPPEIIGGHYAFTIDDTDMELRLAPDGRGIELAGRLGQLGAHPLQAAAQLRRLLVLGLGLASVNRAALVFPAGADRAALEAMAVGDLRDVGAPVVWVVTALDMSQRKDPLRAVQDVMQWRHFARPVLGEDVPPATQDFGPERRRAEVEQDYYIFQP